MTTRTEEPAVITDGVTGSLSAYADGDAVGGAADSALQWSGVGGIGGVAYISDVVITLQTASAADMTLILYGSSFTAGTDNAAFSEAAGDIGKHQGAIEIDADAFVSLGGNVKMATITNTPILVQCAGGAGGTLYGQLVARGSLTLTDAAISVKLGIYRG